MFGKRRAKHSKKKNVEAKWCITKSMGFSIPSHFGVVEKGIYRSAYPEEGHLPWLLHLGIRTVVLLSIETLPSSFHHLLVSSPALPETFSTSVPTPSSTSTAPHSGNGAVENHENTSNGSNNGGNNASGAGANSYGGAGTTETVRSGAFLLPTPSSVEFPTSLGIPSPSLGVQVIQLASLESWLPVESQLGESTFSPFATVSCAACDEKGVLQSKRTWEEGKHCRGEYRTGRDDFSVEDVIKALVIAAHVAYHPVLFACPTGELQTTVVCGCLRRYQYRSISSILQEGELFLSSSRHPLRNSISAFIISWDPATYPLHKHAKKKKRDNEDRLRSGERVVCTRVHTCTTHTSIREFPPTQDVLPSSAEMPVPSNPPQGDLPLKEERNGIAKLAAGGRGSMNGVALEVAGERGISPSSVRSGSDAERSDPLRQLPETRTWGREGAFIYSSTSSLKDSSEAKDLRSCSSLSSAPSVSCPTPPPDGYHRPDLVSTREEEMVEKTEREKGTEKKENESSEDLALALWYRSTLQLASRVREMKKKKMSAIRSFTKSGTRLPPNQIGDHTTRDVGDTKNSCVFPSFVASEGDARLPLPVIPPHIAYMRVRHPPPLSAYSTFTPKLSIVEDDDY